MKIDSLKYIANEVRKHIIDGVYNAKSGHPGGSLSIAELVTFLYMEKLNIDLSDMDNPYRDRLVLSKGHCVPAIYGILAQLDIISKDEIKNLRHIGSKLQGHPSITMPGIDMSTGSLGQGFSAACGMALAAKIDNKDYKTYAILGDGELQEGIVWETAMFASHNKLSNLIAVVDNNGLQIDGNIADVCSPYPIDEKFKAFGWNVCNCDNGHDFEKLAEAFGMSFSNDKPTVIIIKTIKGKDISFMENNSSWHGAAPNDDEYKIACEDLKKISETLSEYKQTSYDLVKEIQTKKPFCNKPYNNSIYENIKNIKISPIDSAKATRESYGEALRDFAEDYPDLFVIDADLSPATKTNIFSKKYPERFINCGIAEQNMIGVAAGLAACGKIPFASSFAMFAAGRAYEIIRNSVGYPNLNVKIGATHAGISVGEDGASHQCNEDIAIMRSIPNMVIINPCDDLEAKLAVKAALDYKGPVYIRFGRFAVPQFNGKDYKFELGKGVTLREGTDITIVATGLMVNEAVSAADELLKKGISARVINIHTIKPIDAEILQKAARETGKIVTVEEHSIIGGLGDAVISAISENPVSVRKIGINDVYGYSGPAKQLLQSFGLSAENIVNNVTELL